MLDHHRRHGAVATIGAREHCIEVPFGVIRSDGEQLVGIVEKPVHRHLVNAGIYVLSPDVLDVLEHGPPIDMPDLFQLMVDRGMPASVFPLREYWIDIGAVSDLERARQEVDRVIDC